MVFNGVEVEILASMKLIDAYNSNFPEDFLMENIIYCIHNDINGKNYIGQTVKVINRFSKTYVGHFKDYDKFVNGELSETRALYRAWKKYGLESFTVFAIDTGSCREELDEKEVYWIKTLHTCVKDPDCFGYNLTWGADDMSVTCRESIQRSIETRIEKYGEAFANCHTPEAFAKGNKTKEEKYGHSGFVNAFTPEANEKRRQTNLKRYGTTYGQKASKEAIKKMVEENVEKYGDPMGKCNTPENREKAVKNLKLTYIFQSIKENISKLSGHEVLDFNQYFDLIIHTYSGISGALRHLKKVIKILPELKDDNRWDETLENIFNVFLTSNDPHEILNKIIEDRSKENYLKNFGNDIPSDKLVFGVLSSIKINISNSQSKIHSWEDYKTYIFHTYSGPASSRRHLNKIIEILYYLKQHKDWSLELEKIFGNLTIQDIILPERKKWK